MPFLVVTHDSIKSFVHWSVSWSVCRFICWFICRSSVGTSVSPSVGPSVSPSVGSSVSPSVSNAVLVVTHGSLRGCVRPSVSCSFRLLVGWSVHLKHEFLVGKKRQKCAKMRSVKMRQAVISRVTTYFVYTNLVFLVGEIEQK